MAIDPRFLASAGREVFIGNELLVKGALETDGGVHLFTGYPGSPVAGFFDTLTDVQDLLNEHGVRGFQSNNEALAVAALNGSQMLPIRALAAMKSVGVHVAADALALGNMAGANPDGGVVIIMGEDPWCESTQVPADSRFICEHLRMPVLEPGDSQQLKDWINLAFRLSQAAGLYIGYITTVAQADGGGTVVCRPNQFPELSTQQRKTLDTAAINLDKVLLPPRTWQHELQIPERFAATQKAARALGINRIFPATTSTQQPPTPNSSTPSSTSNQQPATSNSSTNYQPPTTNFPSSPSSTSNQQLATSNCPVGFIVTGMAGPFLRHVLADLGLAGVFPILQMGMSYPADVELVREFASHCRDMVVVEERRSFLEKNIRDALFRQLPQPEAAALAARLYGKVFPAGPDGKPMEGVPEGRGLNYSVLAQRIIPLIQAATDLPAELRNGKLSEQMARLRAASRPKLQVLSQQIVPRTATFCPGCPHRDSSAALLEVRRNFSDPAYMRKHHQQEPVDLVAHGDTGCYTMLMFPPTEQLMHNYSGMGLGGGTGSGIDPFITNKQIVFMGDSTFFHSGQLAITNSVTAGQDITYIILQNGTTAMTGHQEHAGTETDLLGHLHPAQSIERIVGGMVGVSVRRLSPADRDQYRQLLEQTILKPGVKVIIADKECGITHHRTVLRDERRIIKEKGFLPRKTFMNVTAEVCENCLECTKQTACPGLTLVETDYGRKIDTDLTWCVNDGACERVRVTNEAGVDVKPCPSFEEVTVVRRHRRRYMLPNMNLDKLPEPQCIHPIKQGGAAWRAHMAGVGGMGIGLAASILVRAGHKQGYRVIFADRKGLAIRNGGVFSQITFLNSAEDSADPSTVSYPTASIPYGAADLLLGVDILESARAIDPREQFRVASTDRTAAVLNTYKQPTVMTLLGRQDFDPDVIRDEVFAACREDHSFAKDISSLCERRLGSKQYANIMMLGVAFQLGLIPVSAHSIAWAIRDSIKREHRKNLKAFNIGRKLALEPRALPNRPRPETWEQLLVNKTRILRRTRLRGRTWALRYERLVHWSIKQMPALTETMQYDLALRIYDIQQYQDHHLARAYVEHVRQIYRADSSERGWAATAAAIHGMARVTLIKDEPYVAYLLTRYEKIQRDIAKYGADTANGDRLVYRHFTSPEFHIGPWRFRPKLRTRNWQLHLVRRCKWWRKLPGWHEREVAFRDWFLALPKRLDFATDAGYEQALRILRSPEQVTGYREIRYPKMQQVRDAVEAELSASEQPAPETATLLGAIRRPTHA